MRERSDDSMMEMTNREFDPTVMFAGIDDERAAEVPNRNETINLLAERFGDQKLKYGTHVGTFMQMVVLCPAIDSIVNQGFEAAMAYIGECVITDEEYQSILNPQLKEQKSVDESKEEQPSRDEPEKVVEVSLRVHAVGESAAKVSVQNRVNRQESVHKDRADSPGLFVTETTQQLSGTGDVNFVKSSSEIKIDEREIVAVDMADTVSPIIEVVEIMAPKKIADRTEQIQTEPAGVVTVEAIFEQASGVHREQGKITTGALEEMAATPLPALSEKLPPAYNTFLEPPEYMSRETATVSVLKRTEDVSLFKLPMSDTAPVEDDPYETLEFTLGELDETHFGQIEPVKLVALPSVTEQYITGIDGEPDGDATVTVQLSEMETDKGNDIVVSVVPLEVFDAERKEEMNESFSPQNEMIVGIIAELVGDEVPRKYDYQSLDFLYRSDEAIKKIELLEKAATAEECRERLLEIRLELSALLELLGCKDVDGVVTKLMADLRNIARIKRYLEVLAQAVRQSETGVTRSQVHALIHPRCHRVGQWVVGTLTGGVRIIQPAWDRYSPNGSVLRVRYR